MTRILLNQTIVALKFKQWLPIVNKQKLRITSFLGIGFGFSLGISLVHTVRGFGTGFPLIASISGECMHTNNQQVWRNQKWYIDREYNLRLSVTSNCHWPWLINEQFHFYFKSIFDISLIILKQMTATLHFQSWKNRACTHWHRSPQFSMLRNYLELGPGNFCKCNFLSVVATQQIQLNKYVSPKKDSKKTYLILQIFAFCAILI